MTVLPGDVRPYDTLVYEDTMGLEHHLPVVAVAVDEGVTVRRPDGRKLLLEWWQLCGDDVRVIPAEGRTGEGGAR